MVVQAVACEPVYSVPFPVRWGKCREFYAKRPAQKPLSLQITSQINGLRRQFPMLPYREPLGEAYGECRGPPGPDRRPL